MFNRQIGTRLLVSGLFCEPFGAADAIRELTQLGFAENEIDLLGVLSGHVPDLSKFLSGIGISPEHADHYNTQLEDGAVLLLIHTCRSQQRKTAVEVLKHHGGLFLSGA